MMLYPREHPTWQRAVDASFLQLRGAAEGEPASQLLVHRQRRDLRRVAAARPEGLALGAAARGGGGAAAGVRAGRDARRVRGVHRRRARATSCRAAPVPRSIRRRRSRTAARRSASAAVPCARTTRGSRRCSSRSARTMRAGGRRGRSRTRRSPSTSRRRPAPRRSSTTQVADEGRRRRSSKPTPWCARSRWR